MTSVTVVITHYKSPQVLKLALGYIKTWKENFEKDGGEAEIIVTDSETIKETREMMDELFPDFTHLQEPKNVGFGKIINRAWQIAKGEYIFTINADLIAPRPQEINKLIKYLEENEDVGMAGPRLLNFDETHQSSAFRFYTPMTILYRRTPLGKLASGKRALDAFVLKHSKDITEKPTEVDWLMGSAFLIRKKYLDKVGVFDERFFMYMEDVDLCRRFWENGFKVVYYPHSVMYHFHGKASRSPNVFNAFLNKYARIHLSSAWKYFRKHGLKTPRYGV
ncbi:MAG: glycosyltransferase family 2 protein [Candidatus Spechtbacteria bacterium]|nr:glycosyltransferase family 2 protein [Candidatus Spechtbacteria bacterium]